jgi:hypothetical protein
MSAALVLRWSFGNHKLKKTRTVSFNLPAWRSADGFTVCRRAGACITLCYARQERFLWPGPKAARETNLAIVRASIPLFEQLAIADLAHIKQRIIRVHDSGDFFSQEYLDSWFRIAARYPRKRFYCYTKALDLDWRGRPANWRRVQSYGGTLDRLINPNESHTRIFASHAERKAAGYCDGTATDRPAFEGQHRIGLVYHGAKTFRPEVLIRLLAHETKETKETK